MLYFAPMMRIALYLTLVLLTLIPAPGHSAAQELPRCPERPDPIGLPRAEPFMWCLERVVQAPDDGDPMPWTALATAPDGRLFAARPLKGEVWLIADSDGDRLPDTPQLAADSLTLPNALTYHHGALYIAGGPHIYRLPDEGDLEILVDDLPAGTGLWTGGILITGDERIVVGISAPCENCIPAEPERAALLSFDLNGGDRRLLAEGLRHPAGLALHNGEIYVTDSARAGLVDVPWLDELNRIDSGAHYGWPYCVGVRNAPDIGSGFDCSTAEAPVLTFETHSRPLALASYAPYDAFPFLEGRLLAVLGGSSQRADIRGYQLVAIDLDDPAAVRVFPLFPGDFNVVTYEPFLYTGGAGYSNPAMTLLNQRAAGPYPFRLYGLAISPEGWLYLSIGGLYYYEGGGAILALRPGDWDPCDWLRCE